MLELPLFSSRSAFAEPFAPPSSSSPGSSGPTQPISDAAYLSHVPFASTCSALHTDTHSLCHLPFHATRHRSLHSVLLLLLLPPFVAPSITCCLFAQYLSTHGGCSAPIVSHRIASVQERDELRNEASALDGKRQHVDSSPCSHVLMRNSSVYWA